MSVSNFFEWCHIPNNFSAFIFVILSVPVALQDAKEKWVSQFPLFFLFAISVTLSWFTDDSSRLLASSVIFLLGGITLILVQDHLGEADVIFVGGMALVLPFWSLVESLQWACLGMIASVILTSRFKFSEILEVQIPFIPSLLWGTISVALLGRWG